MSKISELEKLIEPALAREHMEMVDLQYVNESGKRVLRVFMDKEGGITLDDCEKMSEKIGALLDEADILPEAYVLEISSPGLDRVLKKEKDFVRFTGEKARITVFAPVEGQRNFLGTIVSAGNGTVTVNDVTGKTVTLRIDTIARARLEPEIELNDRNHIN